AHASPRDLPAARRSRARSRSRSSSCPSTGVPGSPAERIDDGALASIFAALRYSSSSKAESGHAVDEIDNGPVAPRSEIDLASQAGLYHPAHEHDACGVGFVAHIAGHKSHAIVAQGLKILENLNHRGAVGADRLM